jgi:carbonic anhydrase/acetyltransferase-like protein (isoleucine patch superfamily)
MDGVSLISFNGKTPWIHPSAFIAPGCRIIGDVEIAEDASVWYNCVLRGDVNPIRIGRGSNVQDGTVIHCESRWGGGEGYPTIIGADVLIGHTAIVHGTIVKDRSLIGMGSITMNGCVVEEGGMLAAGAMLTPGKTIGANELWTGRPAKLARPLTDEELGMNQAGTKHYALLAKAHAEAIRAG